jgi:hypothetical protein
MFALPSMVASIFQNVAANWFLARASSAAVTPLATTSASAASSAFSVVAMSTPPGSVSRNHESMGSNPSSNWPSTWMASFRSSTSRRCSREELPSVRMEISRLRAGPAGSLAAMDL